MALIVRSMLGVREQFAESGDGLPFLFGRVARFWWDVNDANDGPVWWRRYSLMLRD
jgi:hypothetical protein